MLKNLPLQETGSIKPGVTGSGGADDDVMTAEIRDKIREYRRDNDDIMGWQIRCVTVNLLLLVAYQT